MEFFGLLFFVIVSYLIGRSVGWSAAHRTVSSECKKLGKFYVNNEVFECTKISGSNEECPKS